MPAARVRSIRLLPDGTPLHNRLLAALPRDEYNRILPHLRMSTVTTGETLQAHRVQIKDVYFPNGGVFSITNEMRNGQLVEVATVGREGMLGVGVFFGDRAGIGRTADHAEHGLQRAAQCHRAVLSLAVADARSRGRRHLPAQAGIPRSDARRASPDRHGGAADPATRGVDREPLWANPHSRAKAPGSRLVRMLRRRSRPFRATRVVAQGA